MLSIAYIHICKLKKCISKSLTLEGLQERNITMLPLVRKVISTEEAPRTWPWGPRAELLSWMGLVLRIGRHGSSECRFGPGQVASSPRRGWNPKAEGWDLVDMSRTLHYWPR